MGWLKKLFGKKETGLSEGDSLLIEAVTSHFERHLGPLEDVFHELISPHVHIDVHHMPPTEERPYHVLFTTGMAEKPMKGPEGNDWWEVMLLLPPEWDPKKLWGDNVTEEDFWPVRALKYVARMPHAEGYWFPPFVSMPVSQDDTPYAGTQFTGLLMVPADMFPPEFAVLKMNAGRVIKIHIVMPLYQDEVEWKRVQKEPDALWKLALGRGYEPMELLVCRTDRPNVLSGGGL